MEPSKEQLEVLRALDFTGLFHQFHRLGHVLLWFAVVAFDVIKMTDALHSVYRENCFSVDFEENPMFAGVKQWSLFGRDLPEVWYWIGSSAHARHPELPGFHQARRNSHPQKSACLTAFEAPFLAPLVPGFPLRPRALDGLVNLGSDEF